MTSPPHLLMSTDLTWGKSQQELLRKREEVGIFISNIFLLGICLHNVRWDTPPLVSQIQTFWMMQGIGIFLLVFHQPSLGIRRKSIFTHVQASISHSFQRVIPCLSLLLSNLLFDVTHAPKFPKVMMKIDVTHFCCCLGKLSNSKDTEDIC